MRTLLGLKCLCDFESKPFGDWGNAKKLMQLANQLCTLPYKDKVAIIGGDINQLQVELKCVGENLDLQKMYYAPIRPK